MNNERYDDELLSAIIDGEADAETVASVEADPAARERLAQMRQGVLLVAEPVPEAAPERRSASIAAALAAASSAPEITSLAAARHERDVVKQKRSAPRRAWIAGVAAAAAFLIAIPLAISIGGSADTDVTAADAVEDVASDDSGSAIVEDAMADDDADVMEDEVADAEEESFASREDIEEAMEDDAANDPRANRVNTSDLPIANTVDEIDELIADDTLSPKYDAAAVVDAGVSDSCVRTREGVSAELAFDLINLDSFGGATRLILVEFADDGTTRVLDAEDCSALR